MAAVTLTSPRGGTTTVESLGDLENYMRRGFAIQPGNTTDEYRRVLTGQAASLQVPTTIAAGATVYVDGALVAPGTTVTRDIVQVRRWMSEGVATPPSGLPLSLASVDRKGSVFRGKLTAGAVGPFMAPVDVGTTPLLTTTGSYIRASRTTTQYIQLYITTASAVSGETTFTMPPLDLFLNGTAKLTGPALSATAVFGGVITEDMKLDWKATSTAPTGTVFDIWVVARAYEGRV